jgi:hypothetical protein
MMSFGRFNFRVKQFFTKFNLPRNQILNYQILLIKVKEFTQKKKKKKFPKTCYLLYLTNKFFFSLVLIFLLMSSISVGMQL